MDESAIERLFATGFRLMFHSFYFSYQSSRVRTTKSSLKFLAGKLSQEGLTDSNSLLAERFEYVEVSGGWLMLKSNLVTCFWITNHKYLKNWSRWLMSLIMTPIC
jgi:hypothetical protein